MFNTLKVKALLSDLKAWAWSVPTYDEPYWDKVDEVVDNGLALTFENKFGEKVNEVGTKFENWATEFDPKVYTDKIKAFVDTPSGK